MKLPSISSLQDKVAVVTGGGGVLCSVLSRAIAAAGAKVAILDLHEENAVKVAGAIEAEGGVAKGYGCNVLDKAALDATAARVEADLGPVDILLNGAGGNHPKGTTGNERLSPADLEAAAPELKTFYDLDPAGIQFVFDLNILGTLMPTQAFTKHMVKAGRGCILNISSMNAFRPLTKIPAYSAAKAGVSNFTQWLAVHFSQCGVRVNAIAPGFFLTNQNRALLTDADGSLTARGKKIVSLTPMGRFGDPEDLVGTVLWLLSDEAAAFVTGVVVPVDGGFNAFSGV
ncbi:MAG: SDR family oxidoreductase [Kiritimatiellae bacterium]|nr:SDR family oxidoreductase [Kiritimatiellia bacterium]